MTEKLLTGMLSLNTTNQLYAHAVILFDQFYFLFTSGIPNPKIALFFAQFCLYFPKYNENLSIYLFPNVKAKIASQNRR